MLLLQAAKQKGIVAQWYISAKLLSHAKQGRVVHSEIVRQLTRTVATLTCKRSRFPVYSDRKRIQTTKGWGKKRQKQK